MAEEGTGRRKQAMIEATISVIAEHGLGQASIERITSLAGVSRGLARYHFKNKAELLQTVYRYVTLEFQATLDADGIDAAPRERLSAWIENSFKPLREMPEILPVWLALTEAARTDQSLHDIWVEANQRYYEHLHPLFESIVPASMSAPELKRAVDGFIALLDGLWFELCVAPLRMTPDHAKQICEDYLDRLIDGGRSGIAS